jgi:hypothetical protein
MKKKLLVLGCIGFLLLGQAQAKPIGCDTMNNIGVRLYYAGYTDLADAIFSFLNERGCYDGSGL